ncbi:MAG TPA: tRNA (adenosine(37)-N6)-threonylcarbamoyltransferase complex ATPase subunit type 1 TsaE [Fimbriimonadaceae bacterium]|nr:tRNA (adenosine(37)-N6)-threonylcarbamoyltransferase complex ATPase subunit type 1 TsaE [Fimbriimonadaceae bacterium]
MLIATEAEMRALGAELAKRWRAGDAVLLEGPLGAGKTTLVRGLLESLGVTAPVRSPTYNLLQVFDTDPPVLHADLYRAKTYLGIGLEDYLETHLCLIEWPDRAMGLLVEGRAWLVRIDFTPTGRTVDITEPDAAVTPW